MISLTFQIRDVLKQMLRGHREYGRWERVRPNLLLGLALALALFLTPAVQAASPPKTAAPSKIRAVTEKSAKSLGLQTEMPVGTKLEAELFEPPVPKKSFEFSPSLARTLLWGAGAVLLIILLCQLYKNFQGRSRSRQFSRQEQEIFASSAGVSARMDEAQVEADELARRGLFAQAMHVLLLQSLSEMRRRLSISIASSLTSREILTRIGLSSQGHAALADIIGRVELTHFGEYEAAANDYLACRHSFEALTGALKAGGAA